MRDFTQLEIWKRSHALCLRVYEVTKSFPKEELFGLVSQMRKSSSSAPTNIAEGCGRKTNPQTIHFFDIAIGSLSELQYQCILSFDLGYINATVFEELHDETIAVRKMTIAYQQKM